MKSILKRSVLVTLIATIPFLQGCDEADVAIGIGIIAVGAAAVIIDNNHNRGHRDHNRGVIRKKRNRRGGHFDSNRGRPDRGRRHRINSGDFSIQNATAQDIYSVDTSVFAEKFQLSNSAASNFIGAFEDAQLGDLSSLESLGFSSSDLFSLSQFKMISQEGLDNLSLALQQNPVSTKTMVQSLLDTAAAESKTLDSFSWKACVKAGEWKTDENNSCKETFWSGCSPETGAQFCVPVTNQALSI